MLRIAFVKRKRAGNFFSLLAIDLRQSKTTKQRIESAARGSIVLLLLLDYSTFQTRSRLKMVRSNKQHFVPTIVLICLALLSPLGARAMDQASSVTERNTCDNDTQCLHGGVCAEPNENHAHQYCHCAVGYVGDRCNSFCPLECQNGGYCRYQQTSEPSRQFEKDRNPADYMCQCFGLFEGAFCEIPYMNCGDGTRCYNGGICKLLSNDGTSSICECPRGFGGPTCQSAQEVDALPSTRMDNVKEGFQGNKTALVCGILFVVIFFAFCAWYVISFCFVEDTVPYQSVVMMDGTSESRRSNDAPRWRNIV